MYVTGVILSATMLLQFRLDLYFTGHPREKLCPDIGSTLLGYC